MCIFLFWRGLLKSLFLDLDFFNEIYKLLSKKRKSCRENKNNVRGLQ